MRDPTSSPVSMRVPHGRACHPCSPRPQDRANEPVPSLSGPRRRWTHMSIPWPYGIRSIVRDARVSPRAALPWRVEVGADVHPLSGCIRVGVPCRSIALGEMRDASGPARGRRCGVCILDAYIRLEGSHLNRPRLRQAARLSANRLAHACQCDLNQEG